MKDTTNMKLIVAPIPPAKVHTPNEAPVPENDSHSPAFVAEALSLSPNAAALVLTHLYMPEEIIDAVPRAATADVLTPIIAFDDVGDNRTLPEVVTDTETKLPSFNTLSLT